MPTVVNAPLFHFGVVSCLAICTTAQFVRDSQLYQQELSESTGKVLRIEFLSLRIAEKLKVPTAFDTLPPNLDLHH